MAMLNKAKFNFIIKKKAKLNFRRNFFCFSLGVFKRRDCMELLRPVS